MEGGEGGGGGDSWGEGAGDEGGLIASPRHVDTFETADTAVVEVPQRCTLAEAGNRMGRKKLTKG